MYLNIRKEWLERHIKIIESYSQQLTTLPSLMKMISHNGVGSEPTTYCVGMGKEEQISVRR